MHCPLGAQSEANRGKSTESLGNRLTMVSSAISRSQQAAALADAYSPANRAARRACTRSGRACRRMKPVASDWL